MKRISCLAHRLPAAGARRARGQRLARRPRRAPSWARSWTSRAPSCPASRVTLTGPRGGQTAVTRRRGQLPVRRRRAGQLRAEGRALRLPAAGAARRHRRHGQDRHGRLRAEGRRPDRDGRSRGHGVDGRRQELGDQHQRQRRPALARSPIYSSTSTGLLNDAPGINSSSAYGGQEQLRQRAAAGRRGHARPRGRVGLDVLQPEPDRGNPDRRPRRAGRVRRVHRRHHQHDHQVGRQRLLGPLLDALHQRLARRPTT